MDLNHLEVTLGKFIPTSHVDFHLEQLNHDILGRSYIMMMGKCIEHYMGCKWKDCLAMTKILLNITWEHLNTGHWKDVHITWRHCYTICSFLKAVSEYALWESESGDPCTIIDAVKTCDMGLLMGAPILENILCKLVPRLQRIHSEKQSCVKSSVLNDEDESKHEAKKQKVDTVCDAQIAISPDCQVKVIHCPSLEHFRVSHMEKHIPVIIEGAMDYWPSMGERKWSLGYIKQVAGCRTVPIELGSRYTEDSWSQSLMTIGDFIQKFIEQPHSDVAYLAQHQLFDQIPELQNDISIPAYCCLGENEDVDINAWFGPSGTISPLHQDPKNNLLAQVVGHKYIKLYSTAFTSNVYPHESRIFSNTSQVDVENPDLERFPLFKDAPFLECILKPGDMLYIPPKYWHYVRSLSLSFSVSFWWE